jgi:hypothetical protein
MTIYTATQNYVRPGLKPGLGQLLKLPKNFPVDASLLRAFGKPMLFLLPVVLLINLAIVGSIGSMDRKMVAVGNERHQLMDQNIGLLATKARLYAPEHIKQLAAEKLSLYVADKEQVAKFNSRQRTFRYN